jgi:hypothetical protein
VMARTPSFSSSNAFLIKISWRRSEAPSSSHHQSLGKVINYLHAGCLSKGAKVSNNFDWVLQAIGVLSVQCSVFSVQYSKSHPFPELMKLHFKSWSWIYPVSLCIL